MIDDEVFMKKIILSVLFLPVLSFKGEACFSRAGEAYLDEIYRSSASQPGASPDSHVMTTPDQSSPLVEKSRDGDVPRDSSI